jgi:hypothetical protein
MSRTSEKEVELELHLPNMGPRDRLAGCLADANRHVRKRCRIPRATSCTPYGLTGNSRNRCRESFSKCSTWNNQHLCANIAYHGRKQKKELSRGFIACEGKRPFLARKPERATLIFRVAIIAQTTSRGYAARYGKRPGLHKARRAKKDLVRRACNLLHAGANGSATPRDTGRGQDFTRPDGPAESLSPRYVAGCQANRLGQDDSVKR